ncbi:MAG: hypothetical protein HZB38_18465 [Planctomycetes bacterium]|nr:hypothetical protein [Planctomycetota bacterium]
MQNCCTDCAPRDGSQLGSHCSDSNTGAIVGTQSGLGPKWQVNPVTGVFSYPPANPAYSGTVARRLQARIPELQPSGANDQYFVEGIVISADDAVAGNGANNASYRPVSLAGSGQNWNLALSGSTVRGRPAIYAWQAADQAVRIEPVQTPDGGWLIVGARANPLPGQAGYWHYEYAVFNLNSELAIRSFDAGGPVALEIQSLGFHDVDYHSGDGPGNVNFAGTDWTVSTRLTWETETFDQNQSANALRWGTLYNFRVDVAAPPSDQALVLGVFQPSTPDSVATPPLPAPGLRTGDTNGDGIADLHDLANLLAAFGTCAGQENFRPDCDFDRNGCIELADLAVLLAWFGR